MSAPQARSAAPLLGVGLLFFVSGFPALVYQIAWQRALFALFGVNVESVTVVVTAFMLGLGFGSLLGGRLSRHGGRLLLVFAVIEAIIGLYGLVSLDVFGLVGAATVTAPPWVAATGSLVVVFLPTLLMGATLPLLTTWLVARSGHVGRSVGLLYFVNTLGSALACFLTAWLLMRLLGLRGSTHLAAVLNALVALAALVLHRRDSAAVAQVREAGPVARPRGFRTALVIAAISGFLALSYELLWFRIFSFASGTRTSAFGLVLGAYLGGLALGSIVSLRLTGGATADGQRLLSRLGSVSLLGALMGYAVIPATASLVTLVTWQYGLALLAVASGALGIVFPLVCHLGVTPDARAGDGLSRLYVANILGSAAGSLLTGLVLMDVLTMSQCALLLLGLGLVLSALLYGFSGRTRFLLVGAIALAVLVAHGALFDRLWERLLHQKDYVDQHFPEIVERRGGVITVTEDGAVFGSGGYDGWIRTDLVDDRNMIVRAYAASLFHAEPKEVLVIGLATGAWAEVLRHLPTLQRMTIIEIEPGYLEVIARRPEVSGLLSDPRVTIVIDDGRRWLARHPERRFDFILQNTPFHWRSCVSNLLSADYFELVKAHLAHGGVFYFNTTGSHRAIRTATDAFPHVVRFVNFVATSLEPFALDATRWESVLRGYRTASGPALDLSDPRHVDRLREVVAMVHGLGDDHTDHASPDYDLEGWWRLRTRFGYADRVTDDNMGTEW